MNAYHEKMEHVLMAGYAEKGSDALTALAAEIGMSMAQMALIWCTKNPNVSTVILGASKASQLTDNLAALDVVPKLTEDVLEGIETILGNKPDAPPQY